MRKAPLRALALLVIIGLAATLFVQATIEPRGDTAPSTAPTGERATKTGQQAQEPSGVKEESTAESEGRKADSKPSPKAPKDGTHAGQ